MSIRYTKQRTKYDCSPTALVNALKWSGLPIPYRGWVEIFREAMDSVARGTRRGTPRLLFDQILRENLYGRARVRYVPNPRLREIDLHLRKGGSVALGYYWWHPVVGLGSHTGFIAGTNKQGSSFRLVNMHREGPALQTVTRDEFKGLVLRHKALRPYNEAWFLTRCK